MTDARLTAFLAVDEKMDEGLKKHVGEAWRDEPISMHLQKAARHLLSALLLLDHPEYTKDAESISDHIKQGLTRAAMALDNLEGL